MRRSIERVARRYMEAAWGGGTTKHKAPRGGIMLARLGGLSPVVQTNKSAPVSRGYWAFIWPYIEMFLVGSTDDFGPVQGGRKSRPSRAELNKDKKLRLRKFRYEGLLWTGLQSAERFAIQREGYWFLVDAADLSEIVRRTVHNEYVAWAATSNLGRIDGLKSPPGAAGSRVMPNKGPIPLSKDILEVFVPANMGRVTGRPRPAPGLDDEPDDPEGE